MDKNEKSFEASLENWRNGAASIEDVRSLAQDLGAYRYMPGIPVLVELMDHKDDMVRYNAAGSLGSNFVYTPASGRFLKMLANDPETQMKTAEV